MLFVLAQQVLSSNIKARINDERITRYKVGRGEVALSHPFYADDVLLFTNGSSNSLTQLYESFSGIRAIVWVVCTKSYSYLPDKFARRATVISRVTGYSRKNFPFNYLGVPITNGRLQTIYFEQMMDKVRFALE